MVDIIGQLESGAAPSNYCLGTSVASQRRTSSLSWIARFASGRPKILPVAPAANGRPLLFLLFLPEDRSVHTHVAAGLRLTPPREQMGSSGCIANLLSDSTRAMLIGHGHEHEHGRLRLLVPKGSKWRDNMSSSE